MFAIIYLHVELHRWLNCLISWISTNLVKIHWSETFLLPFHIMASSLSFFNLTNPLLIPYYTLLIIKGWPIFKNRLPIQQSVVKCIYSATCSSFKFTRVLYFSLDWFLISEAVVRRCSVKKVFLWPATLFKKILWHRCFPVSFAKFLRIPPMAASVIPY